MPFIIHETVGINDDFFIWANKYFIWINEFKNKYYLQHHSASQYVTEIQ